MTRYQRIKQTLDALPKQSLRVCESKGPCSCRGCITSLGISKELFEKWKKGQLS